MADQEGAPAGAAETKLHLDAETGEHVSKSECELSATSDGRMLSKTQ